MPPSLTIDYGAELLKDKINSLIVTGHTKVVLNLALLWYMDSSGLGQLVSCHNSLAKTTGGLRLLNLTKRNIYLLSMARLVSSAQVVRTSQPDPIAPQRTVTTTSEGIRWRYRVLFAVK